MVFGVRETQGTALMNSNLLTALPALPRRALVVAETVIGGSALSADFDDVHIVTPDELESAFGDEAGFAAVVITGVSTAAGRLADVVARTLRLAPADVLVVLDASDHATWQELRADPGPLAGLSPVGVRWVSRRAGAVFRREADSAVPQLAGMSDALTALERAGVQELAPPAAPASAPESPALLPELRERLDEVSRDLAVAHAALAEAQVKNVPQPSPLMRFLARGRMAVKARGLLPLLRSRTVRRMVLPLVAAFVGLLVLSGISIAVAAATDTGVKGGFETAGLLFLIPVLLYLVRGVRRVGRNSAATRRLIQRLADSQQTQQREMRRLEESVARRVAATSMSTGKEITAQFDALRKESVRHYSQSLKQTQAMQNLFGTLPVNAIVPLMGGWAASADVVLVLVDELMKRRPALVVECGSGVSTMWLAVAIRKFGLDTRVVALEHDPHYAALTREVLDQHGVGHIAEVRDAALVPTSLAGHETPWYEQSALADLDQIGLLFVDGPPEATGPRVRYPAVPLLRDRFAGAVTIVLDDLIRESEQEISKAWEKELPDFTVQRLLLEKGAAVLRRG
jgi:hypothetical protein